MGGVINRIMATDIKATALAGNFKLMGEVSVWDAATGQNKLTLPGHAGAVSCLAFAADAKQLASGSTGTGTFSFSAPLGERQQGQLKLWDVAAARGTASAGQGPGVVSGDCSHYGAT